MKKIKTLSEIKKNEVFTLDYIPNRSFTKGKWDKSLKAYLVLENNKVVGKLSKEDYVWTEK